jgi:hypothetical protein
MIYLQEIATAQEFKIIPRSYEADSMVITNEFTNVAVTYAITPLLSAYYMVINEIVTLQENNNYTIKVLNGTSEIFYGKIYCTNQDIANFSINDGEYIQHESNNEYIILND